MLYNNLQYGHINVHDGGNEHHHHCHINSLTRFLYQTALVVAMAIPVPHHPSFRMSWFPPSAGVVVVVVGFAVMRPRMMTFVVLVVVER